MKVLDNRLQAISIRLGPNDIRRVKQLARRLGVRDSDVIRFALKWTLMQVAPLCDPEIRGQALLPMFVEVGREFIRHFELDAVALGDLINKGVEPDEQVEHEDIALLAMAGSQAPFAMRGAHKADANPSRPSVESLREYLYEKYVYAPSEAVEASNGVPKRAAAAVS